MTGNHLIAGLSTRPYPKSKTSAATKSAIQSIGNTFNCKAVFFELSEVEPSLRAASYRIQLGGPAKSALDAIEQSGLLIVGMSVRAPKGYPAMLRYLLEMADPTAIRRKPTILVETHCNVPVAQSGELETRMLMGTFGLDVIADIRLSSRELLKGILPGDERMVDAVAVLHGAGFATDSSAFAAR